MAQKYKSTALSTGKLTEGKRERRRRRRRRSKKERRPKGERKNEVHTFSFFPLHQNDDKAHFFSVFLSFSLLTINCLRLDIAVECEISPRVHLNDSARAKLNEKVKSEPVAQPAQAGTHSHNRDTSRQSILLYLCVCVYVCRKNNRKYIKYWLTHLLLENTTARSAARIMEISCTSRDMVDWVLVKSLLLSLSLSLSLSLALSLSLSHYKNVQSKLNTFVRGWHRRKKVPGKNRWNTALSRGDEDEGEKEKREREREREKKGEEKKSELSCVHFTASALIGARDERVNFLLPLLLVNPFALVFTLCSVRAKCAESAVRRWERKKSLVTSVRQTSKGQEQMAKEGRDES